MAKFLNLPLELREEVYATYFGEWDAVLPYQKLFLPYLERSYSHKGSALTYQDFKEHIPQPSSLTQALSKLRLLNRTIYEEATQFFYGHFSSISKTTTLQSVASVPSTPCSVASTLKYPRRHRRDPYTNHHIYRVPSSDTSGLQNARWHT